MSKYILIEWLLDNVLDQILIIIQYVTLLFHLEYFLNKLIIYKNVKSKYFRWSFILTLQNRKL